MSEWLSPKKWDDERLHGVHPSDIIRAAMLQVLERAAVEVERSCICDSKRAHGKCPPCEEAARIRSIDLDSGEIKP